MSSRRIFFILFITDALVNLAGQFTGIQILSDVTKPLIVPFLVGYYVASTPFPRSIPLMVALLACWLGDVALMFVGYAEIWFMAGLASFLVGHLFYIIIYRQFRWESVEDGLLPVQKVRFSLPVVLAGTGLIVILFPVLGGLKFPVMIYAIAIMVMVMNAIFRFGRTNSRSFWLVLAGALMFMISDSILALNKFRGEIEMGGVLIMMTYISAQYLIVEGLSSHEK
ncbi:MAG TPA: lysoplasmalogenase [Cyclobacteriaceae bacterium]|nr:lysoplasmalogenase [Cyclobacteriaceae bacterium]